MAMSNLLSPRKVFRGFFVSRLGGILAYNAKIMRFEPLPTSFLCGIISISFPADGLGFVQNGFCVGVATQESFLVTCQKEFKVVMVE